MTTTHQLMAAAFYLCGLLFLLHVDSVNSLRCKYCSYTNPGCNSGNVTDIECLPNYTCSLIRLFSPLEPENDSTFRACTTEAVGLYCIRLMGYWKQCHLSCSTDNCNSASNLDE
ncbi:uncharacterized protein LOC112568304 isoform X4 [Pomacea canaliculata]|uniref:uncharacterized protein LOC112568304 isoform X2 n=1 Tax=Pomacea canaliculata TaxID=400727 RepID=UPI000D73CFAA|nr:uncharacterized protein LOC112568304 isoform X2 [Pomacea canaliculata]XP_025101359.1 uncharacterized protein LOC112568304 isoform X4 [Pomacea canaliculata]